MAPTRRFFSNDDSCRCFGGAVAQLGERLVRNEEVRGSNPLGSTTPKPTFLDVVEVSTRAGSNIRSGPTSRHIAPSETNVGQGPNWRQLKERRAATASGTSSGG
jgi:hypothetical protein